MSSSTQQLREQIASLELAVARRDRHALALGILLLALFPCPLYGAAIALDKSPLAYSSAYFWLHGLFAGCLLGQWSLIGVFCMLSWRPVWGRCLHYAVLATVIATGLAPVLLVPMLPDAFLNENSLFVDVYYLFVQEMTWLPGMIALAILPSFGMKVFRRATVGPTARGIEPRLPTLGTLFLTTTICALGLVPAKWLFIRLNSAFGDADQPVNSLLFFAMYAGVAALVSGVVHVWQLGDVLTRRARSWRCWTWRIPLVAVAGGSALAIVYTLALYIDRQTFVRISPFHVSAFALATVIAAGLVFWCGCGWMRMLGYGLVTHPVIVPGVPTGVDRPPSEELAADKI